MLLSATYTGGYILHIEAIDITIFSTHYIADKNSFQCYRLSSVDYTLPTLVGYPMELQPPMGNVSVILIQGTAHKFKARFMHTKYTLLHTFIIVIHELTCISKA
jgi:hypothetical protein